MGMVIELYIVGQPWRLEPTFAVKFIGISLKCLGKLRGQYNITEFSYQTAFVPTQASKSFYFLLSSWNDLMHWCCTSTFGLQAALLTFLYAMLSFSRALRLQDSLRGPERLESSRYPWHGLQKERQLCLHTDARHNVDSVIWCAIKMLR